MQMNDVMEKAVDEVVQRVLATFETRIKELERRVSRYEQSTVTLRGLEDERDRALECKRIAEADAKKVRGELLEENVAAHQLFRESHKWEGKHYTLYIAVSSAVEIIETEMRHFENPKMSLVRLLGIFKEAMQHAPLALPITLEQKAVLAACESIPQHELEYGARTWRGYPLTIANAELANRKAKEAAKESTDVRSIEAE
jgi:hypothetical protein